MHCMCIMTSGCEVLDIYSKVGVHISRTNDKEYRQQPTQVKHLHKASLLSDLCERYCLRTSQSDKSIRQGPRDDDPLYYDVSSPRFIFIFFEICNDSKETSRLSHNDSGLCLTQDQIRISCVPLVLSPPLKAAVPVWLMNS